MVKVGLVGLLSSENLGEQFIADSLEWLIHDCYSSISNSNESVLICRADLEGHNENELATGGYLQVRLKHTAYYNKLFLPVDVLYTVLKKLVNKIELLPIRNIISIFRHLIWSIQPNGKRRLLRYYNEKLSDVRLIVIDGAGLLEYSSNEYFEPLYTLSKFAEKRNINVVYNAIGRAGDFDHKDYRCKLLIKAMRNKAVTYISARDSLEDVQYAAGTRHKVKLLADAAFWCKEAYSISLVSHKQIIGIGLIRGDAIQSYHGDFSEEDWVGLFVNIIEELQNRGYQWRLFTNGFERDVNVGKKVLNRLNAPVEQLVPKPNSGLELIQTISAFNGLITCRMHSSIAAFTMGIPSVILSWNKKVEKYMDLIGYSERAIKPSNFDAKLIVNSLEKALQEGISSEIQTKMKSLSRQSVQDYISMLN